LAIASIAIGLVIEFAIQVSDLSVFRVSDLRLIGALLFIGGVGTKLYEKFNEPRWREVSRNAIVGSTINLYYSFVDYAIARTPLDWAQALRDDETKHELVKATCSNEREPDPAC
jgi:hypothetical protein